MVQDRKEAQERHERVLSNILRQGKEQSNFKKRMIEEINHRED
jgi:hypothetical protein